MPVNLSVRGFSLSIGGLDCTAAMLSFTGADSKLTQNGIVSFEGEITLGRPIGFESLDDRLNSRWHRGAAIGFQIANQNLALTAPSRCGSLHILDAVFDRKFGPGGQLQIQAADLLTLLANQEQTDGGPEICLGAGLSVQAAINQLLTSAGVPSDKLINDTIPGSLSAPINPSGGYIAQAGQLAAAQGYFLYVDGKTGRVRAKQFNVDQNTSIGVIDIQRQSSEFDRAVDSPPAQKVKVSGRGKTTVPVPRDGTESVSIELGPASLAGVEGSTSMIVVSRVTKSESLGARSRTIKTIVERPIGMLFPDDPQLTGSTNLITAEDKTETYIYESNSPIAPGSGACAQGNTGRLVRQEIVSFQPQGVAIADAIAVMDPKPEKITQIEAYRETIIYEYLQPQIRTDGAEPLGRGPRIRRTKSQPIGSIIPDSYGPDAVPTIATGPSQLTDSEYEVQYWRQPNRSEWVYERSLSRSVGLAYPDRMARQIAYYTENEIGYSPIAAFVYPVPVEREDSSSSKQNQPPAPETMPASSDIEDIEATGEYSLPIDGAWPFRDKERSLSFEHLTGNTAAAIKAQANYLARIWGVTFWGRYKGSQVTCPVLDFFLDYAPLDRADFDEGDAITQNLIDGFSISMTGGDDPRAQVQVHGIYLGREVIPAVNTTVPLISGIRSIPASARFDGMIAFSN